MAATDEKTIDDLLSYWFADEMRPFWFNSTTQIDEQIRQQYRALWIKAKEGGLESWRQSADGALALTILLDQMPLNMFRGQAQSFATESQAIAVAKYAIKKEFDQQLSKSKRSFIYMPLMHSENIDDQNQSVALFTQLGNSNSIRFAQHHRGLIKKFARFPHRNAILGRESTADELEYLASKEAFTG